ncbi:MULTISPECIES: cytochrome c oxidase assembly protein [Thauera]|jgi:cytochrome c oxidase assembly protein subunit 11|uniref:Cytochrome c oxidase assembly protein CtaG n=1 Tax=Thauera aminoaromatica TaxID=164330 RepID=C4ZNF5_THASP|nr:MULTISPECIES: cytochrome c oxidase assembly protein [Thauera]MDA0234325.1 cytochrome c oxidase assembly protein [Pseudomonadota bacterium]OPZ04922.1 MAG: Cytochrome c oxidase assembly protein CtaG [Alphaproteobacteria bacterium ADurb.BinA305]HNG80993.1 cytochrome c oxidase assembly protein [Burkholderiaceae bacterium]HNW64086.1 cytochrome c oxidase assembly protein [Piscinibacter sp.]ACK53802.1 cytochrome c oxidase assembly protein CtaG/Cox11 [Thauera aminoaromatica]
MSAHRSLINKLLLACAAMFAFGFALVPLYDVFCDITGINGKTDKVAAAAPDRVDRGREVSVEFLATHDPAVAVDFAPETARLRLNPGELQLVSFVVENRSDQPIVTTAVPSVSPGEAARHFMKIECFCFQEQPLAPGERKLMPVQFYVDPELPERFKNLTLSYRLYRSVGQRASR